MNLNFSNEEDRAILQDFIQESMEGIERVEQVLLQIDGNVARLKEIDPDIIDKIFRTFHSIKGSAGFIGLTETSTLMHHAETLLDAVRKQKMQLKKEHVDLFLELCDFFGKLLNEMQETFSEEGLTVKVQNFVKQLTAFIENPESEPPSPPTPKKSAKRKAKPAKESAKKDTPARNATKNVTDKELFDSLITPEMVKQFVVDSKELLEGAEQDLLALEKDPANLELAESAFRALHSLKGNAGFFEYLDIVAICHHIEFFLERVRSRDVQAASNQISLILQVLDFIRKALENLGAGKLAVIPGKPGLVDLMKDVLGIEEQTGTTPPESASEETEETEEAEEAEEKLAEESLETGALKEGDHPKAEEEVTENVPVERSAPTIKKTLENEFIRVDVSKLNQLMDLVGEIVIAESMVSQHPDILKNDLPDFEKSVIHLQKNIRELQELATSLRMIPLTGLFRKMIRLVRDISNKSGKDVELKIEGGETEVDRSVIEHISDPLVHIIRNAMDHGLEKAEERIRTGKPPKGEVVLDARQVGGEIWISIQDNGRGLNREKILSKAVEKGIVNGNSDDLPDEKVWNLIFAPGFSTAEKVTDISGRGVGMDVVQRNIEKIRGRVVISSTSGEGTTFTLRIPLTTAIIDGMIVRVGNSLFAVPMLDIKESLQVNSSSVVNLMDGQEVVKIREKLFPVVRLHEVNHIDSDIHDLGQGILILVENGDNSICLFADELVGQKQLVIKPIPDYLSRIEGVSGCAIMGDGNICLILDIANLIKLAESQTVTGELEYAK